MANHEPRSAVEPIVYLVRAVERVEERLSELNTRVAHAMTHRRKTPNARVRNAHIAFVRGTGGKCPVCDLTPLFDEEDRFVGNIHHTEAASLAGMDQVMAVCGRCNSRHNFDPIPRAIVESYQVKRRRVAHHHPQQATLGPLFDQRKPR